MTPKIIIDASVVLKWIATEKEEDRESALRIYDELLHGTIQAAAPTFLLIETANILKQKKKLPKKETLEMLKELVRTGIRFVPSSAQEANAVAEVAYRYGITTYDALYVHLAQSHRCPLLTYDEQLLRIKEISRSPASFLSMMESPLSPNQKITADKN